MAVNSLSGATDPINKGIIDAKGDLIAGTQDNTVDRVAVGSNEQRLVANSATATGLSWVSDTTNYAITAKGDILAGTAADTVAPLTVGANGQVLTANSATATGLSWTTLVSSSPITVYSSSAGTRTASVSVPSGNYFVSIDKPGRMSVTIGTTIVVDSSAINVASTQSSVAIYGKDGFAPAEPTSWTTGINAGLTSVAWTGVNFILTGYAANPNLATSPDGVTWTTRTYGYPADSIFDEVVYGGGRAIASITWFSSQNQGVLLSSTDNGVTWNAVLTSGLNRGIFGLKYDNATWVAVGGTASIYTSTNGTSWTTRTSNLTGTPNISAVAFGAGSWVIGANDGQMRRSTDNAATWTTITSNFGSTWINDITYGNGAFVAVGGAGQIRRSLDGINWTTVTSNFGTTNIASVTFNNGWFIAGGTTATRLSTDGTTWTTAVGTVWNNGEIRRVAYGDGRLVASNSQGIAYTNVGQYEGSNSFFATLFPSPSQAV